MASTMQELRHYGCRPKRRNAELEEVMKNAYLAMAVGMAIGVGIGSVVGAALNNTSLGISIGIAVGAAAGYVHAVRKDK